ncbi:MAG: CPBP family intramembrane glutamic endopeptidase, partial [Chloroflexota bacterium]
GRWYLVALIPPAFILAVLLSLGAVVSPAFAPKILPFGILFGVFAGLFEETGWMGYAFPKLRATHGPMTAGILLGVLWGFWHLPVVDFLGVAGPHGAYRLPFFLAFVAAMIAIRLIIVRVYERTGSVLLAMLIHASSTGFLVVLSPSRVSAGQEALWYAVYAAALWIAIALVGLRSPHLVDRGPEVAAPEGNLQREGALETPRLAG